MYHYGNKEYYLLEEGISDGIKNAVNSAKNIASTAGNVLTFKGKANSIFNDILKTFKTTFKTAGNNAPNNAECVKQYNDIIKTDYAAKLILSLILGSNDKGKKLYDSNEYKILAKSKFMSSDNPYTDNETVARGALVVWIVNTQFMNKKGASMAWTSVNTLLTKNKSKIVTNIDTALSNKTIEDI
jgi:hypothetical protein